MAKKKAVAKKAAPKANPLEAVVINGETELIDGQYFTADYKKPGSRAAIAKIAGQVNDDNGTFYLGNPTHGEDDDDSGDEYGASSGFGKYISVEPEIGRSITKELACEGVTNYKVVSDKRAVAVIEKGKFPKIGEWSVKVSGNFVSFGCGDVELTKDQVKEFNSVIQAVGMDKIRRFVDTLEEFDSNANLYDLNEDEIAALAERL